MFRRILSETGVSLVNTAFAKKAVARKKTAQVVMAALAPVPNPVRTKRRALPHASRHSQMWHSSPQQSWSDSSVT